MDMIYAIGTYLHFLTAMALLIKILICQECIGISGKTQILYAIIFTTRYLDLATRFISEHNTMLKIVFLVLSYCTVISIYVFFRKTHQKTYDTFRIELLIILCMCAALLFNHEITALEVFWAFSIYLEAVAMLPQFHFIAQAKKTCKHIFWYIMAMGYRCLYIVHWIYYYYKEDIYDIILISGAFIQLLLYSDFYVRVMPYLEQDPINVQPEIAIIESTGPNLKIENAGVIKNGHLKNNISTILLTPSSLVNTCTDKVMMVLKRTYLSG